MRRLGHRSLLLNAPHLRAMVFVIMESVQGKSMRAIQSVIFVLAMMPVVAQGEADTFHLGNGHSGSKTITTTGTIVNSYAILVAWSQPGDTSLVISDTTGFSAGD